MLEKIKLFINILKLKIKIRQVEKRVLRFKLYEWQKDVILHGYWDNKNVPWYTRGSGKTLAYDLYYILNNYFDCSVYQGCVHKPGVYARLDRVSPSSPVLDDETNVKNSKSYRQWHMKELQSLYNQIKEKGITIRDIEFSWM